MNRFLKSSPPFRPSQRRPAVGPCGKPAAQQSGQMPPPEVNVGTVQARDLPATFEQVARSPASRGGSSPARDRHPHTGTTARRGGARGRQPLHHRSGAFQATVTRAEADGERRSTPGPAQRTAAALPLYEAKATSQRDYDDAVSPSNRGADVKAAKARLIEARLDLQYARGGTDQRDTSRALQSEGSLVQAQQTLSRPYRSSTPSMSFSASPRASTSSSRAAISEGRLALPKDGKSTSAEMPMAASTNEPASQFTDVRVNRAPGP